MTLGEMKVRPRSAAGGDRTTGLLLCAAGWAGGGVLSAVIFQGSQPSVDPTLDPFVAVVAGCLLVGPVAAAGLLWQWKQIRMVSTVAALTAVGVLAAVPVLAAARALTSSGQAFGAIVAFVALWGVALPVAVRAAIVAVDHPWLTGDTDADEAPSPWYDQADAAGLPTAAPSPGSLPAPPGPPVDDRLPPVRLPSR